MRFRVSQKLRGKHDFKADLKEPSICVKSLDLSAWPHHPCPLTGTPHRKPQESLLEELIRVLAFLNVSQFLHKLSACGKTGESQPIIAQQEHLFLMKMLRLHLEDALERTSLALLSGGCPQSSSTAAAGMSAETDDKIKC